MFEYVKLRLIIRELNIVIDARDRQIRILAVENERLALENRILQRSIIAAKQMVR